MSNNYARAFSEVSVILTLISNETKSKISDNMIDIIEKEKDKEYIPKFDKNIALEKQNLMEETISILALIKLNYLCVNSNEKEFFTQMLNDNEKKYYEEINQKYDYNNIFNKKELIKQEKNIVSIDNTDNNVENKLAVIKEDKWYKKIFKKIINFLKINN